MTDPRIRSHGDSPVKTSWQERSVQAAVAPVPSPTARPSREPLPAWDRRAWLVTIPKAMIASAMGLTFLLTLSMGAGLESGEATLQADDNANVDLFKPFQGTWASYGEGIPATWIFDGEKITASIAGVAYIGHAKIDPAAKPHPTIDLAIVYGPATAKGKTVKGIYKLDGERLTLCITAFGGEGRPEDFAQVDDDVYLYELKKKKKKD